MKMRNNDLSLALVSDGGVLLDLRSGALLQLNKTAAFVWNRYLSGDSPEVIAGRLTEEFPVDLDRAESDVARTLNPQVPANSAPLGPPGLRYRHTEKTCDFSVNGIPVLEMTPTGDAIRTCGDPNSEALYHHLRSVSPKILALQGVFVLHASAVQSSQQGITAFAGESGAGKTTTARAFASAGKPLICEDKLVLHPDGDRLLAFADAEAALESRLVELHSMLKHSRPLSWCDTRGLRGILQGPPVPIERVLVIDEGRRAGTTIETERMGETASLVAAFVNAFHGSSSVDEWRRQFASAATLIRTTPVFLATVPRGIDRLLPAAKHYSDQVAS